MSNILDAGGVGGGTVNGVIVENNPGAAASTAEAVTGSSSIGETETEKPSSMDDDNASNDQLAADLDDIAEVTYTAARSGAAVPAEEARSVKLEDTLLGTMHSVACGKDMKSIIILKDIVLV